MDSYEALAAAYDELTEDVEYKKRAGFVEKLFLRAKRPVRSLLDLACGTGTMTELFARRGYTVTGVDYSPEMLAQAQQKLATLDPPPLLLCQSMPQLELLEKVDAAICCLDSINYLTRPRDVQRTFEAPEYETTVGIDLTKLDAAQIAAQIAQAKAMLPEGHTFKSVGRYQIEEDVPAGNSAFNRNKTFGQQHTSFVVRFTEDGKETESSAGKTSYIYYEAEVTVEPDGTLSIEEN